jgi:hypothetical protein
MSPGTGRKSAGVVADPECGVEPQQRVAGQLRVHGVERVHGGLVQARLCSPRETKLCFPDLG